MRVDAVRQQGGDSLVVGGFMGEANRALLHAFAVVRGGPGLRGARRRDSVLP